MERMGAMTRWILGLLSLLWLAAPAQAGGLGIQGGAERYRYEPGDQVLYQSHLADCPVGEYPPDWRLARGAFECARFRDRIWLRPLEAPTVLFLAFPRPLPPEFSLEFPVWVAEDGCPFVEFRLHTGDHLRRLAQDPNAYAGGALLGGHLSCEANPSAFGARDLPGELRFELRTRLAHGTMHRIAVQVRRGQARFYVDGRRVAHRPFRPGQRPAGLSLYFYKHFETSTPYADAPVLVGDLRVAGYSRPEAAPGPEQDLIRELGAQETPEGLKVTLGEALLFDLGDWHLKAGARPTLEKLARLAALRRGTIRVEGHTDDRGPERFNQVLSELRAHVVALELARLGVDPKRLAVKGYGERRPLVPNDSEAHRARNRRVEVILAAPGGAGG
ncbi:MAG: OmpA family protein [Gammaproteobacteria bacterium]|nr:MAG: OmpA family protein [Gammaproteobacteria bacterium]